MFGSHGSSNDRGDRYWVHRLSASFSLNRGPCGLLGGAGHWTHQRAQSRSSCLSQDLVDMRRSAGSPQDCAGIEAGR
eukprot:8877176-Alexandrium_andersonii.AAC.1